MDFDSKKTFTVSFFKNAPSETDLDTKPVDFFEILTLVSSLLVISDG